MGAGRIAIVVGLAALACRRERPAVDDQSDTALATQLRATAADVALVLGRQVAAAGGEARPATVQIVDGDVDTACGRTADLIGFYCERSATIYLGLDPYRRMRRAIGATAHRRQALIVAHEYGHHAQALLGIATDPPLTGLGEDQARSAARALELQAECLAGVWARHTTRPGFATAAELDRLAAVGPAAPGSAAPGRHGSAPEQQQALRHGHAGGTIAACVDPPLPW